VAIVVEIQGKNEKLYKSFAPALISIRRVIISREQNTDGYALSRFLDFRRLRAHRF